MSINELNAALHALARTHGCWIWHNGRDLWAFTGPAPARAEVAEALMDGGLLAGEGLRGKHSDETFVVGI